MKPRGSSNRKRVELRNLSSKRRRPCNCLSSKMLKAGRMTNNRRSHCTLAEYESTGCVLLKFPHGGNNQETGIKVSEAEIILHLGSSF